MAEFSIHLAPSGDDGSRVVALHGGAQRREHRVGAPALRHVRHDVTQRMATFESERRPWMDPVHLAELGRRLHSTFLAPLVGEFQALAADGALRLVFTSTEPEYLNSPWELLPGADG